MNLSTIKTATIGVASKAKFAVAKKSPEILLAGGIVSIVTGTVVACKATLKADEVLDDYHEKMNTVAEAHGRDGYSEKDEASDKLIIKVQTVVDFAKLYLPSVALVGGGIAMICGSYGIMRKRNLGLVAAYTAVQEAFTEYRKRVVEELGEEKDKAFRYGIHKEKIDVVDENGKKRKETVDTIDEHWTPSGYARIFDETNRHYCKLPESNLTFLRLQQSYANDLLNIRGHVFLNEVYDMIGFPQTKAGAVVGWIKGEGDNYIDFGIYNVKNPKARDFVNGYEKSIILDFNVDGVIWHKLQEI